MKEESIDIKIENKEDKKYINLKVIEIRLGEGRHPYKCVAVFENGFEWVLRMSEIEKVCEGIGICEDLKYPFGLGRNMFLLAHLFETYKEYLTEHGFKPNSTDYLKSQMYKIKSDVKVINFVGGVKKDGTCKME